jgi:hypothetical protein
MIDGYWCRDSSDGGLSRPGAEQSKISSKAGKTGVLRPTDAKARVRSDARLMSSVCEQVIDVVLDTRAQAVHEVQDFGHGGE